MRYIGREHIDTAKWDECINKSSNGSLYGYSFYLDHMAKNWDALVYGDYDAVMPLTWNRKYGIKYLHQPAFTQQLGIFTHLAVTEQLVETFIKELKKQFRFAEIFFNHGNRYKEFEPRPNYILSLRTAYSSISENYKNVLEKNLRRAANSDLEYRKMDDIGHVVELYRTAYGRRFPGVKKEDYEQFKKLCFYLQEKNAVILRGAFDTHNSLLASILLLKGKNRVHLLHAVTLPEARPLQANHFLLDNLINEFAGDDLILDFEGSAIPGIANFYRSFGAVDEPYFFYRYNNLSWPLKFFK